MGETCPYHTEFVKDIAILKENTNYIRNKICKHVDEGEKEGGFRDRLLLAEQTIINLDKKIDTISRGRYIIGIVGGLIGALIGSGSNDALVMLIKWIMGIK